MRADTETNGAACTNGHTASTKPTNVRTWQVHVRLVKEAMQEQEKALQEQEKAHEKKVKARFKIGQRFEDAKRELDHGDYGKMLKACGKDEDYARGHRKIAGHHILGDSAHARKMPSSWYTHFLLTQLPDDLLLKMLVDDRIRGMERRDVEKIIKRLKPARPLDNLISKLQIVQPAIAINPTIPLLTHYWFTSDKLLANNGQIAIQVPFKSDFAGAVPNGVLDLLKAAGFKGEINLASKNGNLLVTEPQSSGVRSMTLKMLQPTFPFAMPGRERTNSNPQVIAELVGAIRYCLISVGADTSIPECLGITLERDGERVMLYSFDGSTISRTSISALPLEKRTTLPSSFCKQMVRLYDSRSEYSEVAFEIGQIREEDGKERYALFTAGDVKLYGRIIESRIPYDFRDLVAQHLPKGYEKRLVDIPERLRKAVALASVVCNEKRRQTKITVRSNQLRLLSKEADKGIEEVQEVMPLASTHGDVTVTLEPKQLRHISDFDKMLVTTNCIIMTKTAGNELHLVSCCSPRE
jgi:DNA polymerase III sliding clamp (beta) subunit (PCNA family)